MPYAAAMDKLTTVLTTESIQAMLAQDENPLAELQKRGSLVDVARDLGGLEDHEAAYIESIPQALREAMRAAIVDAASAGKAVHLQFSPAYDFSVQLWDYGTALSVHLSGPYPPDFPRNGYEPARS
jgi:hypothetical protein